MDEKIEKFAEVLVERSVEVEEGDYVYLIAESLDSLPLFEEVRRQVIEKGAFPHEHLLYDSQVGSEGMDYDWIKRASKDQLEHVSTAKVKEMKDMDCYIRIGGPDNTQELSGLDSGKITVRKKATKQIFYERDDKDWVTTRWPTDALAQSSGMPTQELREYIFNAVTEVGWDELEERNRMIKERFDEGNQVRIKGEETDISFSIESRTGVNCRGIRNVPDGEVFYAPRKESVQGEIKFSFPGVSNGNTVKDIKLKFKDGKVVKHSAEANEEFLTDILNKDNGSRFIGEFGIGTNTQLDKYVGNSLLDEKIFGTIHLALGRAYRRSLEDEESRNDSGIHWDLVKDLRNNGRILLDGETVFKNGKWLLNT